MRGFLTALFIALTSPAFAECASGFTQITVPLCQLNAVQNPPVINSPTTASGTVGTPFSYQITATNSPTSFGATNLPNPLTINTGTGLISGTPSTAAVSTIGLSATNPDGTGTQNLTLTVAAASSGKALIGNNFTGYESSNSCLVTNAQLDTLHSRGFTVGRIPFDLHNAQPTPNQPLSTSYMNPIIAVVQHAQANGNTLILDAHNYGSLGPGNGGTVIDQGNPSSVSAYVDFWTRMATMFKPYPNVIFDLMNEPSRGGINAANWAASEKAALAGIRTVDTARVVHLEGIQFSSCTNWASDGNGAAWNGFVDPSGGPTVYHCHQYLDVDASGVNGDCVSGAGHRVDNMTAWLHTQPAASAHGFLGEGFGGSPSGGLGWGGSSTCDTETNTVFAALKDSVWNGTGTGLSVWSAGTCWGDLNSWVVTKMQANIP